LRLRRRRTYDKPPIVALLERRGDVVLRVAEKLNRDFILELMDEHVKRGQHCLY